MRLSIIDLGSNSVRFDVYQLFNNQNYKKLYSEKLMIQLGKDVFAQGVFSKTSIHNTTQVFKHFNQISKQLYVDQTHAYATAAVRQAKNKQTLINQVFKSSTIKLKEISGNQEAKIIYQGLKKRIHQPEQKTFLCIDIGGGSTELTLNHKKRVFHHSIPLGSSLIKEQFIKNSPPSAQELEFLQTHIKNYLKKHMSQWPKASSLEAYGSSGTVKGIIKVLNKGNYVNARCSSSHLSKLIKKTAFYDHAQLKTIPYLEEKRIDMFTGGNILLDEILKFFNCSSLRYTDIALKEGLLDLTLKNKKIHYRKKQNAHFSSSFFKQNTLSSPQKQSLLSSKKFFKQLFNHDQSLIDLCTTATLLAFLCNSKKQTFNFSNYLTLVYDYPFFQSKEEQNSIIIIFKLMFEMSDIKNLKNDSFQLKKAAIALKFLLWNFSKNSQSINTFQISKKTFTLKILKGNFLQQKQFDQIKKSFEEQFDLKIKLL